MTARDGYVRMGDCCWYPERMRSSEVIGEGVIATVDIVFDGRRTQVERFDVESVRMVSEPLTSALIARADVDRLVRDALQSGWECDTGTHGPKPLPHDAD